MKNIHFRSNNAGAGVRPGRRSVAVRMRLEIIKEAFLSGNIAQTCRLYDISRTTYYNYKKAFIRRGSAGLANKSRAHHSYPRAQPEYIRNRIIQFARDYPKLGYKKIFRILRNDGADIKLRTVRNIMKKNKINTYFLRQVKSRAWRKTTCAVYEYC